MARKRVLLILSVLASLAMILVSCASGTTTTTAPQTTSVAPATTSVAPPTTKPSADTPKYGGTLVLQQASDVVNWDPQRNVAGLVFGMLSDRLVQGDWTRGNAGGYGTKESDWAATNVNLFNMIVGDISEGYTWTVDAQNDTVTVTWKIRKGIHWGLNSKFEASRLVNGRELTTDDIVFSMNRICNWELAGPYVYNPWFRGLHPVKTGPQELSLTGKGVGNLIGFTNTMSSFSYHVPPEVIQKYGDMQDWRNQVGAGPFMIADIVMGSEYHFIRNPSYWMKDPIGPGKGNQLPYLDGINILIIPDVSTRLAALRTGKIDEFDDPNTIRDDVIQIKNQAPQLIEKTYQSYQGRGTPLGMRMDKPGLPWGPQDDPNALKVRRAMMMAINYQEILKNYYGGEGQIVTWPQAYTKEYAPLYIGLDDKDFPASAKELYSYNPDKAKQLLTEAGYPNGFKCSAVLTQAEVDYYSLIKGYWSKVGIDFSLDVREPGVKSGVYMGISFPQMITFTTGPVAQVYTNNQMWGDGFPNSSRINDPVINQKIQEVKSLYLEHQDQGMAKYREIFSYIQDKAYVIPNVAPYYYQFWWPWLKNYSGEMTVGVDFQAWPKYIWCDQDLKKTMGY